MLANWQLGNISPCCDFQPRLLMVTTVGLTHWSFLLPFARHFRNLGWKIDGMAAGISDYPECRECYNNVFEINWSRSPLKIADHWASVKRIRQIVKAGNYDIVHLHTPVAALVARFALRNLSQRVQPQVVYTAHGFHFHKGGSMIRNALFLALEKLAGYWTDQLVVINKEDLAAAKASGILPPDRIHFSPGIGIDLTRYHPPASGDMKTSTIRQSLNLEPSQKLLLMVAYFDRGKRHADLLNAAKRCKRKDYVIAFAGNGALEARMKKLAESLGISSQLRFLGFRDDLPELIRCCDSLILPSEREGLPRSVMEAMASGVPVIGADARGTRDLLALGGGVLYPVGDVDSLARAIGFILDNPEKASEIGKKGRVEIKAYEINKVIRLHEEVYEAALKSRNRSDKRQGWPGKMINRHVRDEDK